MKLDEENLQLIYVHKTGYNSKGDGLYDFIFSKDPENIDVEGWCWDISPACDNALPPSEEFIDEVISLKTRSFNLFCLHEAVDRPQLHGYHTIHALAYETDQSENQQDGYESFEEVADDVPLLVFHYGMTLTRIKEMLEERKIILKNHEFIETSSIKF